MTYLPDVTAAGDRLDQIAFAQVFHGVAKSADARQHQLFGARHRVGVGGHQSFVAQMLEGFLHRAQVVDRVIQNRNHVLSQCDGQT